MAKFCIKCGKPLVEGQICPCQLQNTASNSMKQQTYQSQQPEQNQQVFQSQQPELNQQVFQSQQPEQSQQVFQNQQPEQSQQVFQNQQPEQSQQVFQNQQPEQNRQAYQQPSQYQQPYQQYTQNNQNQQYYQSQQPNVSSSFLHNLFSTFKNILCSPTSHGVNYVASTNSNTALSLFGLQAIASALFALVVGSKINSLISLLSSLGGYNIADRVKMPITRIFFVTVIGSFGLSCLFAGILLVICLLFKIKTNYKAMLCVTSVRSAALVPVTLIAIVLFYLNIAAGMMFFYLGNLISLFYVVAVLMNTYQESKNKVPVIVFITAVIFAFISLYIMYQGIPYYLPDSVKAAWKSIRQGISNPSEMLQEIMGDY